MVNGYEKYRLEQNIYSILMKIGICFFMLLYFALTRPVSVSADIVPKLSEEDFNEAVVEITGEYDWNITKAQAERNPYINKRLILNSSDPYVDPDDYNAVEAIQDKHGNYILQFKTYAAARRAEAYLAEDEATNYVEPDYPVFAADINLEYINNADSDGSESTDMKGLTNSGSGSLSAADDYSWDLSMMGLDTYAEKAASSAGNSSAVVAVLDTGISFSHELISNRILSDKAKSFVSGCDVNEDEQSGTKLGHGTHVAGIIARCTPGLNVNILPVCVLDSSGLGGVSIVISGINYAVSQGADVINLSLAGAVYKRSAAMEECIAEAVNNNVAVVAASGNGGKNITADYVTPAYISDCIVVGSVDSSKDRTNSSNYGETVDVVAPGVNIYSSHITSEGKKTYTTMSGTSMAAPHVSAEAAMLKMVYHSISAQEIESKIQTLVTDLGAEGKDNYYGFGLPCLAHTVTFHPGDHGSVAASTITVAYDEVISSVPETIGEDGYDFAGWFTEASCINEYDFSTHVTTDVTLYAKWTQLCTVTWKNADGNVLKTDNNVSYGTMPYYTGITPSKESTAQYSYTFSGWSPQAAAITGDVTYTATYTETVNKYIVTWKNADGNVLKTDNNVSYGTMPYYTGITPSKESTAQYSYTFLGWSPQAAAITGDVTYTATYTKTVNKYIVTWKNADGSVLKTDNNVSYGTMPYYTGTTPTQESTAQYSYTFSGWSPQTAAITGDVTYTAAYTRTEVVSIPETPSAVTPETPSAVAPETPSAVTPETPSETTPETPSAITPETPSVTTPEASAASAPAAFSPVPAVVQEPITIPKKPASVKIKVRRNKVSISWKKIRKTKKTKKLLGMIKSIQIQCSTDPNFQQNVMTKRVGKNKTNVSLKLKKKTQYYVRMRYVGKRGVSAWTGAKIVKIK